MKSVFFFLSLLLFSCQAEKRPVENEYERLGQVQLHDSYRVSDTILAYRDTIPFWSYDDGFNPDRHWDKPGKTKLRFPGFKLIIDREFETKKHKDTLTLFENVGHYFEGRNFWIESEDTRTTFTLEMRVHHAVNEIYPDDVYTDTSFNRKKWEEWEKDYYHFEEYSKFYPLQDSAGYYRLNWAHYGGFFEEKLKKKYHATDTLIHIPGEMGGITSQYAINNIPVTNYTSHGIFKIIKTNPSGKRQEFYFHINYSYGC